MVLLQIIYFKNIYHCVVMCIYIGSQSVCSAMLKCMLLCTEVKMLQVQKECKAEVRKNNHHKRKEHIVAESSKKLYFVVESYIFGFFSELDKFDTSTPYRVAAGNRNLYCLISVFSTLGRRRRPKLLELLFHKN